MNKSDLSPIEERVQKALQNFFPDYRSLRFVAGVSGGPDSMCMLYILKRLEIDVLVVHINYGKRGKESDKDAELVEQMAFQWGFDCHSLSVDPEEAEGENFQQWARAVRYDMFRALAGAYDADGIAVAHHQDDQIETILQKQFRGAGLAAWSGMSMWKEGIFRPLLHTSRNEIEEYVRKKHIPFRVDKSNLETDFARNFLRNEWLAELEKHFPGWRQNILRIAEQAELFEEALEWMSQHLTDEQGRISREGLLNITPRLRKALALHIFKSGQPDIQIGTKALDELDNLGRLQTGKAIQFTEGLSLMRDREHFKMICHKPESHRLMVLERNRLDSGPLTLGDMVFEMGRYSKPDFNRYLYLDADRIEWPLRLRRWKQGDRFRPFGMEGHQKISDHLANRKVSAAGKNNALVLESFEDTICAVIFPPTENRVPPGTISELVRCDANTRECLIIKRSA